MYFLKYVICTIGALVFAKPFLVLEKLFDTLELRQPLVCLNVLGTM